MKVLHVLDYYPFYVGKVVHEIGKKLSLNGVVVKVVSSDLTGGSGACVCKDDENVTRLRAKRIVVCNTPYVVYDLRDLGVLRKQLDLDIIHIHFFYKFLSLYIGVLKKIKGAQFPLVATSHGLTSGYPSNVVQVVAKLLNELAKRLVVEISSAVTTVSKLEYNYLVKSIATSNLRYIPNGVDTSFFNINDDKRRKLRNDLGIDENDILVLYFTRLRATKGVFTFLKAINQVIHNTDHLKFLIAGSGPLASHVREMESKFGSRVHTLLKYVPNDYLPYLYNASDVYVLPSYVEGMPLSVMEAMACGKPVIVTDVGDMPILVKNGVNGLVIPPGKVDLLAKSIIFLSETPDLRNLMGKTNVEKMKEYDWDKIAKQYHALYSEIFHA